MPKLDILTEDEADQIKKGLEALKEKATNDELEFSVAFEDIHLNFESQLTDLIGPVGGKLHTGEVVMTKWRQICIFI